MSPAKHGGVPGLVLAALILTTAGCSRPAEREGPASAQLCATAQPLERALVPAGEYLVGTNARYGEEGPPRHVRTNGFQIDVHEVTNAEFARFVEETGYVTVAERQPDPADYPDIDPERLVPGSAVFGLEPGTNGIWWRFVPGADWRHPAGPGSDIAGLDHHPVVHVAYEDAAAYAAWAGGRLPTEAEWEIAARGGLEGAEYAWGEEFRPGGTWRANTWQGPFPVIDTGEDGYRGLAPVGCYEPNAFGLHDMTGNVWEWTSSPFDSRNLTGTIRGGSFLCAPNFCARFRPAARQPQEWDFSASHIGFRTLRGRSAPEQPVLTDASEPNKR